MEVVQVPSPLSLFISQDDKLEYYQSNQVSLHLSLKDSMTLIQSSLLPLTGSTTFLLQNSLSSSFKTTLSVLTQIQSRTSHTFSLLFLQSLHQVSEMNQLSRVNFKNPPVNLSHNHHHLPFNEFQIN